MKNRFIQMFLVICAVMLMICAASVWAAAEDATATPTDLAPVEQEESVPETTEPETTEPETTEPEATEPEAQEPQAAEPEVTEPEETADEEEASDSVEIIITKAVRIGDSWSGTMKKTKPAVLKLDIDHAQQVNLVVLGRHGWITVEKSDRLTENPARTLTNDETSQTVISWYAEAGSYLVTLGPVEPNLMAKLNVSFMNDACYDEWLAQQQEEEATEEELTEGTEETEESATETTEEIPEEETDEDEEMTDQPGGITEEETEKDLAEEVTDTEVAEELVEASIDEKEDTTEETTVPTEEIESHTENYQETDKEEQAEEEKEAEEALDEELLLSLGYYKVQVALIDGADLFDIMEDAEPINHLDSGEELWVKKTDSEVWAEIYYVDESHPIGYIAWDDLIIIQKPENEQEEEEELPARYIEIKSTLSDYEFVSLGTEIIMTAEMYNFSEDDQCSFQWKYYDKSVEDYVDIVDATEQTYTYSVTMENIHYRWKLVVTVLNEKE